MPPDQIITKLLKIRGLTTKKQIDEFFNPAHPKDIKSPFVSQPAIDLIKKHIALNNKIAIYGDYDVDGICSTAILWETLYTNYKNVFPHIPHRESEGYGLSIAGIDHCLEQGAKLIITVDNGIVAHQQIAYARSKNCDVIIIDHHEASDQRPKANCILHSTSCCAAGLTWFFCRDLQKKFPSPELRRGVRGEVLELVAIATICDIVPLIGPNRSFAKYGLEELNHTTRPGLIALFKDADLPTNHELTNQLTPYHVGFIIGPRLNAMGRLEHAIDSLRLLCTHNVGQAAKLAKLLGDTNRMRQDETKSSLDHALAALDENNLPDLIVVSDTGYHSGVIGLIAGKLTEKYHRPSIAISIGETESKASCRSISGFHITEYLRTFDKLLTAVGGHAMAAGFTVSNLNLPKLLKKLNATKINPKLLVKTQRVDLEISLELANWDLWLALQRLEPFGMGNPQPVFKSINLQISNIKSVGKDGKHLKFKVGNIDAIWFNAKNISEDFCDVIYQINEDTYGNIPKLQLIVRDIIPGSLS